MHATMMDSKPPIIYINDISKDIIKSDTTLEKLGADSLDRVEIVMKIEDEFKIEINDQDADNINNLEQATDYIYNKLK